MNVAYKHLEAKLRIAELTIGQWGGVLGGVMIAIGWGMYLSPLGATATIVSAVYLGGLPACAALLASLGDFDVWLVIRCAAHWHRARDRYRPGPGTLARGYVLEPDAAELDQAAHVRQLDLATLWDA